VPVEEIKIEESTHLQMFEKFEKFWESIIRENSSILDDI